MRGLALEPLAAEVQRERLSDNRIKTHLFKKEFTVSQIMDWVA
jgi:hypothetical protein